MPPSQAPTSITVTSPNGINENTSVAAGPGVLGVPIGRVSVVDPDGSTNFTFLVNDPRFTVAGNASLGYELYLIPGQSLVYLTAPTIPLEITATNAAGLSLTSPYTVVVNQVAPAPTEIVLSNEFVQPNAAGVEVGQLQTYDPNVAATTANTPGESTYTVSDPRFQVVNDVLELKPGQTVPQSTSPISVQVTSTAANGLSLARTFSLETEIPQTSNSNPPPAPVPPVFLGESRMKVKIKKKKVTEFVLKFNWASDRPVPHTW